MEGRGKHGIFLSDDGGAEHCPFDYTFKDIEVRGSKGWGLWFNSEACTGTKIEDSRFLGNRDGCVYVPAGGNIGMERVVCD